MKFQKKILELNQMKLFHLQQQEIFLIHQLLAILEPLKEKQKKKINTFLKLFLVELQFMHF